MGRSVVSWLGAVARDGALAALRSSRPGRARKLPAEVSEVAVLRAEVERLQAAVVELVVLRGKSRWG